jgi:cytochrome P450
MTQDRRKNPRDDLVSILTHSTLGGAPLPTLELLSYYFLLVVAGNETTRNATTGGLLALIENPDQLELARNDPSLLKPLVEEVVRWTAPVVHFCRTAAEDVEFRGVKFRKNDTLCLFYPSANRDERVFDEPDRFRVDRRPNRHLSFGIGEHVCLGAHVARLELQVIFKHMLARFESVELAGEVERLRSCIVGGIKHMPIRYRIRPA